MGKTGRFTRTKIKPSNVFAPTHSKTSAKKEEVQKKKCNKVSLLEPDHVYKDKTQLTFFKLWRSEIRHKSNYVANAFEMTCPRFWTNRRRMAVAAAVIWACPVAAVLLICSHDISAGLSSASLSFPRAPFLIFSVSLDQTSPVSELNWHHTSVSSQDRHPPPSITLGARGLMGRLSLLPPK